MNLHAAGARIDARTIRGAVHEALVIGGDDGVPIPDFRDGEPIANTRDGEPIANPRDGEPIANPRDGEPIANPRDGEPIANPRDGEPIANPRDGDIVFVHGMTSAPAGLAPVLAALTTDCVAAAWALPGYCNASPLAQPTPASCARRLADYIDAVFGRAVVVVGHSLGSLVAASLARQRPDLVAGLVLANPVSGLRDASDAVRADRVGARVDALRRQGVAQFARERVPAVFAASAPVETIERGIAVATRALTVDGFAAAGAMLSAGSLVDDLADVRVPLWVVTGSLDAVSSPAFCTSLASGRADTRLDIVDGAGHSVPIERTAWFCGELGTFVAALRGALRTGATIGGQT